MTQCGLWDSGQRGFGDGEMDYEVFAARVRRRDAGQDEDADWEEL